MSCDVAAFYAFVPVPAPGRLRTWIELICRRHELLGTVLVAEEGVNGALLGRRAELDAALAELRAEPPLTNLGFRYSGARQNQQVFRRLSVKRREHIVAFADIDVDPTSAGGQRVAPADWNALLDDPNTLVVDTRNDYEIAIGTFPGSQTPRTKTFREFPEFVERELQGMEQRRIAMFCTGGIRCEKASALLRAQGFDDVHQLDGGVLAYLEQVDSADSRWQGDCFVFDGRVSVDATLRPGRYQQCRACRRPLSEEDLRSPLYRPGVSCHHCGESTPRERQQRFEERRRQVQLAESRGELHVGADMAQARRRGADSGAKSG